MKELADVKCIEGKDEAFGQRDAAKGVLVCDVPLRDCIADSLDHTQLLCIQFAPSQRLISEAMHTLPPLLPNRSTQEQLSPIEALKKGALRAHTNHLLQAAESLTSSTPLYEEVASSASIAARHASCRSVTSPTSKKAADSFPWSNSPSTCEPSTIELSLQPRFNAATMLPFRCPGAGTNGNKAESAFHLYEGGSCKVGTATGAINDFYGVNNEHASRRLSEEQLRMQSPINSPQFFQCEASDAHGSGQCHNFESAKATSYSTYGGFPCLHHTWTSGQWSDAESLSSVTRSSGSPLCRSHQSSSGAVGGALSYDGLDFREPTPRHDNRCCTVKHEKLQPSVQTLAQHMHQFNYRANEGAKAAVESWNFSQQQRDKDLRRQQAQTQLSHSACDAILQSCCYPPVATQRLSQPLPPVCYPHLFDIQHQRPPVSFVQSRPLSYSSSTPSDVPFQDSGRSKSTSPIEKAGRSPSPTLVQSSSECRAQPAGCMGSPSEQNHKHALVSGFKSVCDATGGLDESGALQRQLLTGTAFLKGWRGSPCDAPRPSQFVEEGRPQGAEALTSTRVGGVCNFTEGSCPLQHHTRELKVGNSACVSETGSSEVSLVEPNYCAGLSRATTDQRHPLAPPEVSSSQSADCLSYKDDGDPPKKRQRVIDCAGCQDSNSEEDGDSFAYSPPFVSSPDFDQNAREAMIPSSSSKAKWEPPPSSVSVQSAGLTGLVNTSFSHLSVALFQPSPLPAEGFLLSVPQRGTIGRQESTETNSRRRDDAQPLSCLSNFSAAESGDAPGKLRERIYEIASGRPLDVQQPHLCHEKSSDATPPCLIHASAGGASAIGGEALQSSIKCRRCSSGLLAQAMLPQPHSVTLSGRSEQAQSATGSLPPNSALSISLSGPPSPAPLICNSDVPSESSPHNPIGQRSPPASLDRHQQQSTCAIVAKRRRRNCQDDCSTVMASEFASSPLLTPLGASGSVEHKENDYPLNERRTETVLDKSAMSPSVSQLIGFETANNRSSPCTLPQREDLTHLSDDATHLAANNADKLVDKLSASRSAMLLHVSSVPLERQRVAEQALSPNVTLCGHSSSANLKLSEFSSNQTLRSESPSSLNVGQASQKDEDTKRPIQPFINDTDISSVDNACVSLKCALVKKHTYAVNKRISSVLPLRKRKREKSAMKNASDVRLKSLGNNDISVPAVAVLLPEGNFEARCQRRKVQFIDGDSPTSQQRQRSATCSPETTNTTETTKAAVLTYRASAPSSESSRTPVRRGRRLRPTLIAGVPKPPSKQSTPPLTSNRQSGSRRFASSHSTKSCSVANPITNIAAVVKRRVSVRSLSSSTSSSATSTTDDNSSSYEEGSSSSSSLFESSLDSSTASSSFASSNSQSKSHLSPSRVSLVKASGRISSVVSADSKLSQAPSDSSKLNAPVSSIATELRNEAANGGSIIKEGRTLIDHHRRIDHHRTLMNKNARNSKGTLPHTKSGSSSRLPKGGSAKNVGLTKGKSAIVSSTLPTRSSLIDECGGAAVSKAVVNVFPSTEAEHRLLESPLAAFSSETAASEGVGGAVDPIVSVSNSRLSSIRRKSQRPSPSQTKGRPRFRRMRAALIESSSASDGEVECRSDCNLATSVLGAENMSSSVVCQPNENNQMIRLGVAFGDASLIDHRGTVSKCLLSSSEGRSEKVSEDWAAVNGAVEDSKKVLTSPRLSVLSGVLSPYVAGDSRCNECTQREERGNRRQRADDCRLSPEEAFAEAAHSLDEETVDTALLLGPTHAAALTTGQPSLPELSDDCEEATRWVEPSRIGINSRPANSFTGEHLAMSRPTKGEVVVVATEGSRGEGCQGVDSSVRGGGEDGTCEKVDNLLSAETVVLSEGTPRGSGGASVRLKRSKPRPQAYAHAVLAKPRVAALRRNSTTHKMRSGTVESNGHDPQVRCGESEASNHVVSSCPLTSSHIGYNALIDHSELNAMAESHHAEAVTQSSRKPVSLSDESGESVLSGGLSLPTTIKLVAKSETECRLPEASPLNLLTSPPEKVLLVHCSQVALGSCACPRAYTTLVGRPLMPYKGKVDPSFLGEDAVALMWDLDGLYQKRESLKGYSGAIDEQQKKSPLMEQRIWDCHGVGRLGAFSLGRDCDSPDLDATRTSDQLGHSSKQVEMPRPLSPLISVSVPPPHTEAIGCERDTTLAVPAGFDAPRVPLQRLGATVSVMAAADSMQRSGSFVAGDLLKDWPDLEKASSGMEDSAALTDELLAVEGAAASLKEEVDGALLHEATPSSHVSVVTPCRPKTQHTGKDAFATDKGNRPAQKEESGETLGNKKDEERRMCKGREEDIQNFPSSVDANASVCRSGGDGGIGVTLLDLHLKTIDAADREGGGTGVWSEGVLPQAVFPQFPNLEVIRRAASFRDDGMASVQPAVSESGLQHDNCGPTWLELDSSTFVRPRVAVSERGLKALLALSPQPQQVETKESQFKSEEMSLREQAESQLLAQSVSESANGENDSKLLTPSATLESAYSADSELKGSSSEPSKADLPSAAAAGLIPAVIPSSKQACLTRVKHFSRGKRGFTLGRRSPSGALGRGAAISLRGRRAAGMNRRHSGVPQSPPSSFSDLSHSSSSSSDSDSYGENSEDDANSSKGQSRKPIGFAFQATTMEPKRSCLAGNGDNKEGKVDRKWACRRSSAPTLGAKSDFPKLPYLLDSERVWIPRKSRPDGTYEWLQVKVFRGRWVMNVANDDSRIAPYIKPEFFEDDSTTRPADALQQDTCLDTPDGGPEEDPKVGGCPSGSQRHRSLTFSKMPSRPPSEAAKPASKGRRSVGEDSVSNPLFERPLTTLLSKNIRQLSRRSPHWAVEPDDFDPGGFDQALGLPSKLAVEARYLWRSLHGLKPEGAIYREERCLTRHQSLLESSAVFLLEDCATGVESAGECGDEERGDAACIGSNRRLLNGVNSHLSFNIHAELQSLCCLGATLSPSSGRRSPSKRTSTRRRAESPVCRERELVKNSRGETLASHMQPTLRGGLSHRTAARSDAHMPPMEGCNAAGASELDQGCTTATGKSLDVKAPASPAAMQKTIRLLKAAKPSDDTLDNHHSSRLTEDFKAGGAQSDTVQSSTINSAIPYKDNDTAVIAVANASLHTDTLLMASHFSGVVEDMMCHSPSKRVDLPATEIGQTVSRSLSVNSSGAMTPKSLVSHRRDFVLLSRIHGGIKGPGRLHLWGQDIDEGDCIRVVYPDLSRGMYHEELVQWFDVDLIDLAVQKACAGESGSERIPVDTVLVSRFCPTLFWNLMIRFNGEASSIDSYLALKSGWAFSRRCPRARKSLLYQGPPPEFPRIKSKARRQSEVLPPAALSPVAAAVEQEKDDAENKFDGAESQHLLLQRTIPPPSPELLAERQATMDACFRHVRRALENRLQIYEKCIRRSLGPRETSENGRARRERRVVLPDDPDVVVNAYIDEDGFPSQSWSSVSLTHRRILYAACCQHGWTAPMKADTNEKGRAVFAAKQIEKEDFVCEYRGESIPCYGVAKTRELQHEAAQLGSFMFFFASPLDGRQICVDATKEKSAYGPARLINHSHRDPNCYAMAIRSFSGKPKLVFIAKRTIPEEEELLIDYGEKDPRVLAANPWLRN